MKKSKFSCTLIFTFLTGAILASIVTFFATRHHYCKMNFEKRHAVMQRRMIEKLDLDPDQEKAFYAIHDKSIIEGCKVLRTIKDQIFKIMSKEDEELLKILNPEQKERFKEMSKKHIKGFKEKFGEPEFLLSKNNKD